MGRMKERPEIPWSAFATLALWKVGCASVGIAVGLIASELLLLLVTGTPVWFGTLGDGTLATGGAIGFILGFIKGIVYGELAVERKLGPQWRDNSRERNSASVR